ncbi:MAG: hypothetical protein M1823_000703 [Watsoniomyces obsoletus]|nr:MAG: hypothetical protein M1823_000703 [Watsoniomyces obsoletus]
MYSPASSSSPASASSLSSSLSSTSSISSTSSVYSDVGQLLTSTTITKTKTVARPLILPCTRESLAAVRATRPRPPPPTLASQCAGIAPTRLNRRRTTQAHSRLGATAGVRPPPPPPALVRQSDRKLTFVDSLVDSATQIVEVIWPLANVACGPAGTLGARSSVLPLKTFIQETLRRSRTSYSTLQVALYYLICIKHRVPAFDFTRPQPVDSASVRALQCGRRMFLAALILASKYLQDRNYSARAWSKISGLSTLEINANEMTFLQAIDWRLHVTERVFQRWTDLMLRHTSVPPPPSYPAAITNAAAAAANAASSHHHPPAFAMLAATGLPTPPSSASPSPSSSPPSSLTFTETHRKVDWNTVIGNLTPELVATS